MADAEKGEPERLHTDLLYLAGQLPHRGAQTIYERQAAEFLVKRLKEHCPDTTIEDFYSIENYWLLFASYYLEFIIIGLVSYWSPSVAGAYGAVVFGCYLAEFLGFRLWARFLPEYQTQNVTAHHLGINPRHNIIVTAYYDSGAESILTQPSLRRILRPLHFFILACMMLVIATCIAEAAAGDPLPMAAWLRWGCVGFVASCGLALAVSGGASEPTRGANTNASGVAAMLMLAARIGQSPLRDADVWFLAAGSHSSWMGGMRQFFRDHRFDPTRTHIINLESIGAGRLCYLKSQGFAHGVGPGAALLAKARETSRARGLEEASLHALPTAAHIPQARGFKVLTVMGLDEEGMPMQWNTVDDRLSSLNEVQILTAAEFAEDLIRKL